MGLDLPIFQNGSKMSIEDVKKLKQYYLSDVKFRNKFNSIRNAWLLQTVSADTAVDLIQKELNKASKTKN